jgi:valyl-tRNA synthetase
VRGYKHFANKVWNITRFVLENASMEAAAADLTAEDEELVREANRIAATVTDNIEKFRLDLAADTAYHFIWHRFADEIIEQSKLVLKAAEPAPLASKQRMLYELLLISLKLLHPFMPFVTEAIWQQLPQERFRPVDGREMATRRDRIMSACMESR